MTRFYEQEEVLIKTKDKNEIYKELKEAEEITDTHRTVREGLNLELEAKTRELYKQLDDIKKQIDAIEEPLKAQISQEDCAISKGARIIQSSEKALNFFGAMDLIAKGVTSKEDFKKVMKLLLDRELKEIRELSHSRGKDIHVWSWKDAYEEHVMYLATNKRRMLSALVSQRASHIGDYTFNDMFGCKAMVELSRSGYRQGMTMREWLDPTKVKWTGMKVKDIMEFCNKI